MDSILLWSKRRIDVHRTAKGLFGTNYTYCLPTLPIPHTHTHTLTVGSRHSCERIYLSLDELGTLLTCPQTPRADTALSAAVNRSRIYSRIEVKFFPEPV